MHLPCISFNQNQTSYVNHTTVIPYIYIYTVEYLIRDKLFPIKGFLRYIQYHKYIHKYIWHMLHSFYHSTIKLTLYCIRKYNNLFTIYIQPNSTKLCVCFFKLGQGLILPENNQKKGQINPTRVTVHHKSDHRPLT